MTRKEIIMLADDIDYTIRSYDTYGFGWKVGRHMPLSIANNLIPVTATHDEYSAVLKQLVKMGVMTKSEYNSIVNN